MPHNVIRFSKPPSLRLRDYLYWLLGTCWSASSQPEQYVLLPGPLRFCVRVDYGREGELCYSRISRWSRARYWALANDGLVYTGEKLGQTSLKRLAAIRSALWQAEQITMAGRLEFDALHTQVHYVDVLLCHCAIAHRDGSCGSWSFQDHCYGWEYPPSLA